MYLIIQAPQKSYEVLTNPLLIDRLFLMFFLTKNSITMKDKGKPQGLTVMNQNFTHLLLSPFCK